MTNHETESQKVEYLYKEYVRLSERCTSYVQSSFDDIRLYGAIGGVLAWTPIANLKLFDVESQPLIMFLGFLGILVIFIILGIYNAIKQSLVVYYLRELRPYEIELKTHLNIEDQHIFKWSETYSHWRNTEVKKIGLHLFIIIFLILVIFPTAALLFYSNLLAWLYLGIALVLNVIYLNAARVIFKKST